MAATPPAPGAGALGQAFDGSLGHQAPPLRRPSHGRLGHHGAHASPSGSDFAPPNGNGRRQDGLLEESQHMDYNGFNPESGHDGGAYRQDPDLDHISSPAESMSLGPPGARRFSVDADGSGTGPGNKRRKTGPGSRGVANLTPEQLAKKRANDREAQRAIRERQKAKNQEYERRIRDLESQQPYQELQAALRLKDAVEAENADIKRALASIVAMIQPILARPSDQNHQPMYPSPNHNYGPGQSASTAPASLNNGSTPTSAASPPSAAGPHGQQWQGEMAHAAQAHGRTSFSQPKLLNQSRPDLVPGLEMSTDKLGLGFLLDQNQRMVRLQNGINQNLPSPQYRQGGMKHEWGVSGMSGSGQPPSYPQNQNGTRIDYPLEPLVNGGGDNNANGGSNEVWTTPIQNCAPTCPLDSLMLDFLNERRQRAAEGHSPQDIVGPRYPSVSSLLNPAKSRLAHPLSQVFTDILATFPDISGLPERIAVLYSMFLLVRWQIQPTRENYNRLPEHIRPRPIQLYRPHPAWTDHLPFPGMREMLIHNYDPNTAEQYPFENFFIPFTTTLSVNWPYEDMDALLQAPDSDEFIINPVFEQHIRRVENWTLGEAFHEALPGLAGTYTLKKTE